MPGKNIRLLGGRPLIAWAIQAALGAKRLRKVVVSTDDAATADVARSYGAEAPFLRPQEISHDTASLEDVSRHALAFFFRQGMEFDAVLSCQPTNPFLPSSKLNEAVHLMENGDCDSVASVAEITKGHPWIAKRIGPSGELSDFCAVPPGAVRTPRQAREKAYCLTGGVYLRTTELLSLPTTDSHCLGQRSIGLLLDAVQSVDINTELDFRFADFLAQQGHWK